MILRVCIRQALGEDWHLWVDDVEMHLTYMDYTEPRAYAKVELDSGKHSIRLEKDSAYRSGKSAARSVLYGIMEAVSGGGADVEAAWQGVKSICACYTVFVDGEDGEFVYSFLKTALEACSLSYEVLLEEVREARSDKIRFWLAWKFPIMFLSAIVFLPLWGLSVGMMLTNFDFASLSLFLISTFIVIVLIWAFFIYKPNRKR